MLKVSKLCKRYKHNGYYALNNISFQAGDTGLVFIVGESGSGKTTLLNILGSLDKGDSGHVYFNDNDIHNYTSKEKEKYRSNQIGFIFQEHNLLSHMTVRNNILISESIQGGKSDPTRYEDALKIVDLEGFDKRFPNELSTGQKQRVAIARTLIKNPELILADEPTGSLDYENATAIMGYLKEISKKILVIVVSHNVEFASKYADRIIQLDHGLLIDDKIISNSSEMNVSLNKDNQKVKKTPKNNLSLNMILKYTWCNIKTKILSSTILTILISLVVTILAVLTFIVNYNNSIFTLENMKMNEKNTVSIKYSKDVYDSELDEYRNVMPGQKKENIEELFTLFPTYNFVPAFKSDLYLSFEDDQKKFLKQEINGIIEIDESTLESFNFELTAGRLPKKNNDSIEIAISDYLYQIISFKYLHLYGEDIIINSYQSILNKEFYSDNKIYLIVGIIDTKFNNNNDMLVYAKKRTSENEIHNAFFTYKGYYDDVLLGKETDMFRVLNESRDYFTVSRNEYNSKIKYIKKLNSQNVILREGYTFDNLSKDDVLITFKEFKNMFDVNIDIVSMIEDKVIRFADKNYPTIKDEFEKDFGDSNFLNYWMYILNSEKENKYQPGFDYNYFKMLIVKDIISNHENYQIELTDHKNSISYNKRLNIVGVIYVDISVGDLYVSDELYDELYEYNDGDIAYVTTIISFTDDDVKLMDYIYTHEENYIFSNGERVPIDIVKSDFEDLSSFYFYSWILLIGFTVTILYYLSHSILKNEKRKIGLLAALGVKKTDIFKILSYEYIFISLLALLMSILATALLTFLINTYIKTKYLVVASAVVYNPFVIILISLLVIFISVIINFLSVYKYSKVSPTSIIKNNA